MSGIEDSMDAAALFADDAFLDALAAGQPIDAEPIDADPLGVLLYRWRAELVQATPATTHHGLTAAGDLPTQRRRRLARAAVGAAAAVAVLAGGGVAAAAASGPHGPLGGLHQLIFGGSTHTDPRLQRVIALLDQAQRHITAGRRAGKITTAEHDEVADTLTRAEDLLRAAPSAPGALSQRLHALRAALARLPITPEPPTMPAPVRTPGPNDPGTAPPPPSTSPTTPVETPPGATRDRTGSGSRDRPTAGSDRSNGSDNQTDTSSDDGSGSGPDDGSTGSGSAGSDTSEPPAEDASNQMGGPGAGGSNDTAHDGG